jgi:alkylated DNA repair protein (DNA oxidative demethylase)
MNARTVLTSPPEQGCLFGAALPGPAGVPPGMPAGMRIATGFISVEEELTLLAHCETLSFRPFAFHGWFGKRETVSFGWRYDFNESRLLSAPPIPDFLIPVRARAAAFAGLAPEALEQALVIRYDAGAGIGWHRDRPVFERVVGISLLSPCVLRFRRREGARFSRFALDAQPRSAYLLTGESRNSWEHGIAPLAARRLSVTFRSRRAT